VFHVLITFSRYDFSFDHVFRVLGGISVLSRRRRAAGAIALKFHPKHEKRKQTTLTKRTNSH
jgi:hypothetical protein